MKRIGLYCFCVLLLVLMVSCITSDYYGSSFSSHNIYSAKSYSSQYTDKPIYQNEGIVICVSTTDYSFNRPIEQEIKKALEEKKCLVKIMTDYDYEDDKFYEKVESLECRYLLLISLGNDGNYTTFTTGGGIADMSIEGDVYDLKSFSKIVKISTNIYGEKNNYERYASSIETISLRVAKSIANELSKYF